jgi:acetyl esterase/lipase
MRHPKPDHARSFCMQTSNVLQRTPPQADHRIHYGTGELQFGDLFLPEKLPFGARVPLVVFVHGGWWRSEYDLAHAGHLCAALKAEGYAVWSIEYRRVGYTGGGWPTTFQDVAAAFDFCRMLAVSYPLDMEHVVAMGHSAGGHLAFWLAGRHHVPEDSAVGGTVPLVGLRGVVSLAGAVDLRLTCDLAGYFTFAHDKAEVYTLMGGSPKQVPERYRGGNPGELLPFGVPQILLQGTNDQQIPSELPGRWLEQSRRQGDRVSMTMIPDADHFDLIDPLSPAWPVVRDSVKRAITG